KKALNYKVSDEELRGNEKVLDEKGIITHVSHDPKPRFFDKKQKSKILLETAPELKKLILYYLGASAFWLLFGTTVGEFLGLKFIWPSIDHVSWLSFGRLRPVHTNTVFWGFASLSMLGLALFVVSRTSNVRLYSYKLAWVSWILINLTVVIGNITLMAGINNGGGEYREYIWPIMIMFIVALAFTLYNYYKTIEQRNDREIYVSNWYCLEAFIW